MRFFQNFSIKSKLIGIILLVSILTLGTGFTLVIINNIETFKEDMLNNILVNARLFGDNCVTAMVFEDKKGAAEILQKLETIPSIMNGYVYDESGDLFAVYNRSGNKIIPPRLNEKPAAEFKGKYLHVVQPVIYQGQKYGTIYLRASTVVLDNKIKNYLITMMSLMVGLMLLSYFLAHKLQKILSGPILKLVNVTKKISKKADFSVRVEKEGNDEIGALYDGFNEMMEQIQMRRQERDKAEEELRNHQEHLEDLVKNRTSELEEKTLELEQANRRLKEADRLKSIFLASMSHELRTPLNSIIGFTGIILQGMSGEINEEQRKQLTMVKNSSNHLLSLINDLLDISKIESGKVELSLEEFGFNEVVEEVVDAFSPKISEKGLEFSMDIPEGIQLFSDRRRVKQVFMNLVSNAIKFTDQGSVKISGGILKDKILEVRVTDTGIGIKKEDLNKLFKPFQQIDASLTKRYEGTGLGLHLTKKLVALLGGNISAKSEYSKGSEFTFTLPLKYEEEQRNEKDSGG